MSSPCTLLVLPIYWLRPQAALGAKSMQGGRLRPLPGCPCPSEQRAGSVVRIMPCTAAVQCNVRPQRATPPPRFSTWTLFFLGPFLCLSQ
uniref:Putative secreted protein n=1 Tax=Ixodes ricinus TaxID=34613 RepID=A0A6B0UBF4_IXORI